MAEMLPPVVVELRLEIENFKQRLNQAESQLKGIGSTAKSSAGGVSSFGAGVKSLVASLGLMIGMHEAIAFLKESGKAAVEDSKSFEIMAAQIKISTGASREMSKAVDEQIAKMELSSAVMDDKIRPGFTRLVAVTHDTEQALRLQQIALDVSAAKGKDLDSVTQALAKAYAGNSMALNKLAPEVKDVTDKIGYLEQSAKGMAAVAANADPYQRLTVIFDNLKEKIGTALIPILQKFADYLSSAKGQKTLNDFAKAVSGVVTFVGRLFKAIIDNIGWLKPLAIEIVAVTIAMTLFNLSLDTNPIFLMISAIGLLVVALASLDSALGNSTNAVPGDIQAKANAAGKAAYAKAIRDTQTMGHLGPEGGDGVAAMRAQEAAYNAVINRWKSTLAPDSMERKYANGQILPSGSGSPYGGGGGGGGGSAPKKPTAAQQIKTAIATYTDAVASATTAANDAIGRAIAEHKAKIAQLNADAAAKLKDLVEQSKKILTDAFKSATQVDTASLLTGFGSNLDGFINMLKDKTAQAAKLAKDAADLAAKGYSQSFIGQIVAQGPMVGDALAQQLLNASPEQAKAIQDSLAGLEQVSAHGMDAVAEDINKNGNLATEDLRNQYRQVQDDLVVAVADENKRYRDQVAAIRAEQEQAIANATIAKDTTMLAAYRQGGVTAGEQQRVTNLTQELALARSGGLTVNVQADTNATPQSIATATVNAIKLNSPVTLGGGSGVAA